MIKTVRRRILVRRRRGRPCFDYELIRIEGANLTTPADSSPTQLRAADPLPQVDSLRRPLAEWLLLLILAAVQFTVAVDFVIMMPLVSCPRNKRYFVAIKMGRRQGARRERVSIDT